AFAPDFKELDENVEYVEREDEFDWATPGAGGQHDQLVAREQQSLGEVEEDLPGPEAMQLPGANGAEPDGLDVEDSAGGGGEPRRPGQDRSGLTPGGWPGQQGMGQPPPLGSQAAAPRHWGAEMGGPHPAGWPGADAAVGRGGWVAGQALERARWEEQQRLLQHGQGYAAGYTQLQPQGGAAPMDDDDSEY
ncbi:WD_REPEATS_REGION domain-containing protein, partial [Haematococcus lacustris]